ncbi:MAG: ABC transporter ATP-binding protein, partial [Bacteroidota bacterium]
MLLNALVELFSSATIPALVTVIGDIDKFRGHSLVKYYFPGIESLSSEQLIIFVCTLFLTAFTIRILLNITFIYSRITYGRRLQRELSNRLFESYLKVPYSFHLTRNTSQLLRNIQQETALVADRFIMPFLLVCNASLILPLLFVALFWVDPIATSVILLLVGGGGVVFERLVRQRLYKTGSSLQKERKEQLQAGQEALTSIKEIKVHGVLNTFIEKFSDSTHRMYKGHTYANLAQQTGAPTLEYISLLGLLVIILILSFGSNDLTSMFSSLSFFIVILLRLRQQSTLLLANVNWLRANHIAIQPIYADLNETKTEQEKFTETVRMKKSSSYLNKPSKSVKVDGISFNYPATSSYVLDDISFDIPIGTSLGIKGTTGAGKSTLLNILLGILLPEKGNILIDGESIYSDIEYWQSLIGYIPQRINLLDTSIRANVALGLLPNQVDDTEIWRALETAQLSDYVKSLPLGLDTVTGEQGVQLSGGQQ